MGRSGADAVTSSGELFIFERSSSREKSAAIDSRNAPHFSAVKKCGAVRSFSEKPAAYPRSRIAAPAS